MVSIGWYLYMLNKDTLDVKRCEAKRSSSTYVCVTKIFDIS